MQELTKEELQQRLLNMEYYMFLFFNNKWNYHENRWIFFISN